MKGLISSNRSCFSLFRAAVVLFALALFVGCSANFAYFRGSWDVTDQFESAQVLQGHTYYIGGAARPYAIVAIDNNFELESPHWKKVEVTPESLGSLVRNIRSKWEMEFKTTPNGAHIISPDGKKVGEWYAVYDYSSINWISGNRFFIGDPPPRMAIPAKGGTSM